MNGSERDQHGEHRLAARQNPAAEDDPVAATGPAGAEAPGSGFAAVTDRDSFSVSEAVGGPRGIVENALPGVLFVLVYTALRDLTVAVWVAVGAAGVSTVARLVARDTVRHAVTGLVGVALCAFVATRTGQAEDFYLPGLWINAAYSAAYVVSILVRWPLIGVVVGSLTQEKFSWRRDPARLRAYTWASALWAVMFLLRLAVQYPLYRAGLVGPLGTARVLMGVPLFALTAFGTWLILRRVPPSTP